MKNSKQFWDDKAENYIKKPIKDEAAYKKKLAITREYLSSNSQVLEFGCGSGGTAILHSPYVKNILATDLSSRMIEIARQKAIKSGANNVCFKQGTLDSISLKDESFDAVLGLNVLHLLEDVDGAIKKVYQLLKKGGTFISSTSLIGEVNVIFRFLIFAMQHLGLAPYVSCFTRNQLITKLVKAGFDIELEWKTSHESVFVVAKKPY